MAATSSAECVAKKPELTSPQDIATTDAVRGSARRRSSSAMSKCRKCADDLTSMTDALPSPTMLAALPSDECGIVVRTWKSSICARRHADRILSPWTYSTPAACSFCEMMNSRAQPMPRMLPAVAPVVKTLAGHSLGSKRRSSRSMWRARSSTNVATLSRGRCTLTFWSVRETRLSARRAAGVMPPVTKP